MILVNNPGSWGHIYAPFEHAPWNGLTPTDLVFPFFLFAVGNAMSFVMPRLEEAGPAVFWTKILKRSALIFLIGLFLNWWPFVVEVNRVVEGSLEFQKVFIAKGFTWLDYSKDDAGNIIEKIKGVRVMGVLQRIALSYLFASIIVHFFKKEKAFYVGVVMLLLYWALCLLGNPTDPYSLQGWFGTSRDLWILGDPHMYKGESLNGVPIAFDPEGLMSTLPAIVQVIFGYLVGDYIRTRAAGVAAPAANAASAAHQPTPSLTPSINTDTGAFFPLLTGLFVTAVALLITGYVWNMAMPINKKIWTSSYVVFTTGLAIATIATMIYFIEVKGKRGWLTRFFDVFGKNALFVFALSAFLPKGLSLIHLEKGVNPWNWLYKKVLINVPGAPENGSILYAFCVITLMWFICWYLDKKKIYIRV
jgi:predicted acyltransferase